MAGEAKEPRKRQMDESKQNWTDRRKREKVCDTWNLLKGQKRIKHAMFLSISSIVIL
jgi:hypothetical protein